MASLTSVLVLLLSSLLCCGRMSYMSSRTINHVEALPPLEEQRQLNVQQPSFFDKRTRYRLKFSDTATDLTEKRKSAERVAKRLVGLFRCSGWGPSCSWNEHEEQTLRSKQPPHRSSSAVRGVGRLHTSLRLVNAARDRRPIMKFQPFFTLTSGKDHYCDLPTARTSDFAARCSRF